MIPHNCAVMVFAKAPVAGTVKTRLIPALGADGAAALHARLVRHGLALAGGAGIGPVTLWCAPSSTHPFFAQCRERFGVVLREQQGGDLGARMHDAFEATLAESPQAVIIGGDCPTLTADDLRTAAAKLADGVDAVISPATDGGYVLLGLRRSQPWLFHNMSWGTDRVLHETRSRLLQNGLNWYELTERWDVDRPEDLSRLDALSESVDVEPLERP